MQHWAEAHQGRDKLIYTPIDKLSHSARFTYDMAGVDMCECAAMGVNCLGGHVDKE